MRTVETPLGEAEVALPDDQIVIATILRAGLPFHQGFLNYFDDAQNAFVSAYRKYGKDGSFRIHVEYISTRELSGKTLLLVDPMLATGASLALTFQALVEKAGRPRRHDSRRRDRQRGRSRVCEKALFGSGYVDLVRHGRLGADGQVCTSYPGWATRAIWPTATKCKRSARFAALAARAHSCPDRRSPAYPKRKMENPEPELARRFVERTATSVFLDRQGRHGQDDFPARAARAQSEADDRSGADRRSRDQCRRRDDPFVLPARVRPLRSGVGAGDRAGPAAGSGALQPGRRSLLSRASTCL